MKDDSPFPKTHHHHHHLPPPAASVSAASARSLPRTLIWLIIFIFLTYATYTLRLLSSPPSCPPQHLQDPLLPRPSPQNLSSPATHLPVPPNRAHPGATTSLDHVFFGIAASAKLWEKRKEYIKLWYRPGRTRGVVWLDTAGRADSDGDDLLLLPPVKISSDTSRFAYTNRQGHRSAVRISRIVSETVRLGLDGVRWIVMGDDDTVFVPDNLIRVLRGFDHRQYYYIGSHSESHLQNIYFSYNMAYGGGGFAISYPLAAALSRIQDRCIQRYPGLYGSDDRVQACMAELGVPLTAHQGFHQYDVYGNLFGLLAAHPVSPLVSLHHLDVVEPVFPGEARAAALRRIMDGPARLDSAALMQQSICYDREKKWTVSVSWGFAVQVIRGVVSPREMETPARTFLNWYRRADYKAYAFNTRPVARNPCHRPFVYYLKSARMERGKRNLTATEYGPRKVLGGGGSKDKCQSTMAADPSNTDRVLVYKRQDPDLWDRSPRRNCCRVLKSGGEKGTMVVDVGLCKEGEIIEI